MLLFLLRCGQAPYKSRRLKGPYQACFDQTDCEFHLRSKAPCEPSHSAHSAVCPNQGTRLRLGLVLLGRACLDCLAVLRMHQI